MQITEEQYDYVANTIYETLMPYISKDLMEADLNDDEFFGSLGTAIYIFSAITGKTFREVKDDMRLEMEPSHAF